MNIKGFAFQPNGEELGEQYQKRYEEIKNIGGVRMTKCVEYAQHRFNGVLTTPEAKALTELDIALIADRGNLCFGGYCIRWGDRFEGAYYTD